MRKLLLFAFLLLAPSLYAQTYVPLASGNAVLNVSTGGYSFKVPVTAAATVTIVGQPTSQAAHVDILFVQDSSGHAVTFSTGFSSSAVPTIPTTASSITSVSFQYDRSTNLWYVTSGKAVGSGDVSTASDATFGAHTYDFSGVTLLKARVHSGLTTTVNGDFGYDTTNKNWHGWNNTSDLLFAEVPIGTAVNGHCASWVVSSSNVRLGDVGCTGSPTLDSIVDPGANKAFTMGAYTLNFNMSADWGSGYGVSISSSGSNAATGPLFQISSGSGTTHDAFQACAGGTTNCLKVLSTGATTAAISLTAPLYATTTKCAASGTAASPSVVTCAAAPAGIVYCDVAASGTTCTVNTTAVTANSVVLLTPSAADNTLLSKTCNATPVANAAPLLAAKVASTSFTINMPTVTVTGACFEYAIIN